MECLLGAPIKYMHVISQKRPNNTETNRVVASDNNIIRPKNGAHTEGLRNVTERKTSRPGKSTVLSVRPFPGKMGNVIMERRLF